MPPSRIKLPPALRPPLAVALGAIPGALSRYYLSTLVGNSLPGGWNFPVGTLGVNLMGCGAMGFVTHLLGERWSPSPEIQLMITTGFLGAFTTFSSYALEVTQLLDSSPQLAIAYWVGSPLLGVGAFLLGDALGQVLSTRRG